MKKLKYVLVFAFLLIAVLGFGGCGLLNCGNNGTGGNEPTCSVTFTCSEGGKISFSLDERSYEILPGETKTYSIKENATIQLSSTPNEDYALDYWDFNGGQISYVSLSWQINEDTEINAVFKYLVKTVTVVDETETPIKTFSFYGSGLYRKLETEVVVPGYTLTFTLDGEPLDKNSSVNVSEDLTVVAVKQLIDYPITYDKKGGSVDAENVTSYNVESQAITLNNPTKFGYTFEGWTGTDLDAPTKTVTIETGSVGERTYTATWKPIEYDISYDLDGGTLETPNPSTYNIESEITLNSPEKEDYEFDGWKEQGKDYTVNKIEKWSSGAKSFTATWRLKSYYIQYGLDGGTVEPENQSFYTKESETFTLNNPTKAGYTFTGWTGTGLDAPTKTVTIEKGSKGFRAYDAHWELIEYTLNYKLDGNTVKTEIYTVEKEKPQMVEEEGYYIEWKVGDTPWEQYDIVANGNLTVDIDIYKQAEYKVTIKEWGSRNFGNDLRKYHYDEETGTITFVYLIGDEPITLKAANTTPLRTNYEFLYWSDGTNEFSKESLGKIVIDTSIQRDQTFTAIWYKSVSVTYKDYTGPAMPTRILIATNGKVYEDKFLSMENVSYYGTFNEYVDNLKYTAYKIVATEPDGNVLWQAIDIKDNNIIGNLFNNFVKSDTINKKINLTLDF